ncbi:unnamed protein product [Arabis nemorensis]|uniref:Uncharacterized protein n=1 Tax=Arabis nemorensis TaxID=586526 RepID=A0A565CGC0_9BRAS|nr:unnamed protein product [Arabis nemorensis]
MDLAIYHSLGTSCVVLLGLFASGEWKTLPSEMGNYKLGQVSYGQTKSGQYQPNSRRYFPSLTSSAGKRTKNPIDQDKRSPVNISQTALSHSNTYRRWLRIALPVSCYNSAQTIYYDNGGNSKWLATAVQLVGFPVLLPYYLLLFKTHTTTHKDAETASPWNRVSVYVVLVGADYLFFL